MTICCKRKEKKEEALIKNNLLIEGTNLSYKYILEIVSSKCSNFI